MGVKDRPKNGLSKDCLEKNSRSLFPFAFKLLTSVPPPTIINDSRHLPRFGFWSLVDIFKLSQLPTSLSHCVSYSVPIFDLGGEGGNGIVAHRCLKPCQKVDISRTLPNKWVWKRNGRYLDCLEHTVPEAYFRVPSKFPISVPTRQVIYFVIFSGCWFCSFGWYF